MSLDAVPLQELLNMLSKDRALVLSEWGTHALIGPAPAEPDARWAFRTRTITTPRMAAVIPGGLSPTMMCWPMRRRLLPGLGNVRIGRAPSNDVVLAQGDVSKLHARLSFRGEELVLEDAGSANGTFVNGRRLGEQEKCTLLPSDVFTLGGLELRVREVTQLVPAGGG